MGYKTIGAVIAHAHVTAPTDVWVLMGLAYHANDETQIAFPSSSRLARYAQTAPKNVSRSLRRLEKLGYIQRRGRYPKDPANRARMMYQVTLQCNALCFEATQGMHYPQGAEGEEYPPLYPGGADDPKASHARALTQADDESDVPLGEQNWSSVASSSLDPSTLRGQENSDPSTLRGQDDRDTATTTATGNADPSTLRGQENPDPSALRGQSEESEPSSSPDPSTLRGQDDSDPSTLRGLKDPDPSARTPRPLSAEGLIEGNSSLTFNDLSRVNPEHASRDLAHTQNRGAQDPSSYLSEPAPGKHWKADTQLREKTQSAVARAFEATSTELALAGPLAACRLGPRLAKRCQPFADGDEKNAEAVVRNAMYAAHLAKTYLDQYEGQFGAQPTSTNLGTAVDSAFQMLLEGQDYPSVSRATREAAEKGYARIDYSLNDLRRSEKPATTNTASGSTPRGGLTRAQAAKAEYHQRLQQETEAEPMVEVEVVDEEDA